MKKTLLFALCFGAITVNAQTRYLDEVFTEVDVAKDIKYGENYSVLTGTPMLQDLEMDVYTPKGDTETDRPLLIMMHSGSFLPQGVNTLPFGSNRDSAIIELCTRFAKHGYVAAAINYRLGWNPLAPTQEERSSQIINAVYRATHDAKAAIRYFRKDAAATNQYGISSNKIVLGGSNSGGYVALAVGALTKDSELNLAKFKDGTGALFVNQAVWGDLDGLNGTTGFSVDNHKGENSDPQLILNMGGAVGDSSWIEKGELPIISFHGKDDPLTPYKTKTVIVAATQQPVVEVSGSYDVNLLATGYGNQTFEKANISDAYTTIANARSGSKGLFPFPGAANGFEPWAWYNPADPNIANGTALNPKQSKARAMLYTDTIMEYFMPRAHYVLFGAGSSTLVREERVSTSMTISPNPASTVINISSSDDIKTVRIIDITGNVLLTKTVNSNNFQLNDLNFKSGVYFLQADINDKLSTERIVIK